MRIVYGDRTTALEKKQRSQENTCERSVDMNDIRFKILYFAMNGFDRLKEISRLPLVRVQVQPILTDLQRFRAGVLLGSHQINIMFARLVTDHLFQVGFNAALSKLRYMQDSCHFINSLKFCGAKLT